MCLGAAPTPEAAGPAKDEPVKVGYKTFDSGSHASDYYHHLSSNLPQEQNLNEVQLVASNPGLVYAPICNFLLMWSGRCWCAMADAAHVITCTARRT